jgi:predicted DNA-binding protein (MmcQ/YjbR family)
MNIEELRKYCLEKPGVSESFPFDEETLVMKVGSKMFALMNLDGPLSVNLKCEPELAIILRETFDSVEPGYHMNKKHWNTVHFNGSIKNELLCEWIDQSYSLVFESLTKKEKIEILKIT